MAVYEKVDQINEVKGWEEPLPVNVILLSLDVELIERLKNIIPVSCPRFHNKIELIKSVCTINQ